MNSRQARYLAKNPTAMIRLRATGRPPQMETPDSPLIRLLEGIGPRRLGRIMGVQLSPKLGYQSSLRFRTGAHLLRWLKPEPQMIKGEPWPAEACRDKRFQRPLTEDDLRPHCDKWFD